MPAPHKSAQAQAKAVAEGQAAADLQEQLSLSVTKDNLSTLQTVTGGIRMNLGTLVPDPQARDALLVQLGGWRRAFVTSRRNREQLRAVLGQVRAAIRADAVLMGRMQRLARPVLTQRLVMARVAAKEEVRHAAEFQRLLRFPC